MGRNEVAQTSNPLDYQAFLRFQAWAQQGQPGPVVQQGHYFQPGPVMQQGEYLQSGLTGQHGHIRITGLPGQQVQQIHNVLTFSTKDQLRLGRPGA